MALPFKEHTITIRSAASRVDLSGVTLPPSLTPATIDCVVDNTATNAKQVFEDITVITNTMIIVYTDLSDADGLVPDQSEFDFQGVTYIVTAVRKQPSTVTGLGHSIILADRKA